jgi:hypothetical protein
VPVLVKVTSEPEQVLLGVNVKSGRTGGAVVLTRTFTGAEVTAVQAVPVTVTV